MKKLKITLLRERFSHMGKHSGYDQLCSHLSEASELEVHNVWRDLDASVPFIYRKPLRFALRKVARSPFYDLNSAYAEGKTFMNAMFSPQDLIHICYAENNLGMLCKYSKFIKCKLVTTIHQPVSWWKLCHPHPQYLKQLDSLIVLSTQEVDYFEEFAPSKVHFIHHGVDTEFFCPQEHSGNALKHQNFPRCVFSGVWLRDFKNLSIIINQLLQKNSYLHFDLILPMSARNQPEFYKIARHERVKWHANISDLELRSIYQDASLLILPLIDCTANNALLESMACGLPIVSNCVGGITDYVTNEFADLFPPEDIDGFVDSVLCLAENTTLKATRGRSARLHAQNYLDWSVVSESIIDVYRKNIV